MDDMFNFGVDDSFIRTERNKARSLRKTRWWQQKTSSGTCHYCGRRVGIKNLTMDHVIPLARGGRSTKGNLVPCCKKCNTAKQSDLPHELEKL
jgi:5-methylcytosine-specific restriction protein A